MLTKVCNLALSFRGNKGRSSIQDKGFQNHSLQMAKVYPDYCKEGGYMAQVPVKDWADIRAVGLNYFKN